MKKALLSFLIAIGSPIFSSKTSILAFLALLFSCHLNAQETKRPNIIIFMVDDLGWQDLSEPFYHKKTPINERFHTPNIEGLANDAAKFTNAYASSVCTPTRVSLLTGMNAAHHRVTNWTHPTADKPTDAADDLLTPPDWNFNGLSPEPNILHTVHATPFPQLLKEDGYYTAHVGKAHWGAAGTPGSNPTNLGFMINVAGHSAGHPQSYYGKDNYGNMPGKASYQAVPDLTEFHGTDTFLTEALTQKAIQAIKEPIRRNVPFFLNLSHYAVHVPIQADPRFVQKYLDLGLDSTEAAYSSLVEGFDKSMGDITRFLKEEGIYDNTVIIFLSDNGGLSLVPQRSGQKHMQNLPLKAGKGSLYEGGIRIPLLIKNTGKHQGVSIEQAVIIEDLFTTVLEMAQVNEYKLVQEVDGRSLLPLLKNEVDKSWDNRPLIWNYPHKWIPEDGNGINYFSAIRQGDFKLLYDQKYGKFELYNLREDIGESTNLAESMTSKTDELIKLLADQLRRWDALTPVYKNTDKHIPYPDQL